jgi:hypothetical protein
MTERLMPSAISQRVRRGTQASLAYFREHPREIDDRLAELDEEWDIERAIEAHAAGVAIFGLVMAVLGGRRWFVLPAAASGTLLQHAIEGWCPQLPVFRRLGFRTAQEIEDERQALRALRDEAPARSRSARGRAAAD